ncbi:MAG: PAS domain S-box protein [Rhodothermales bacterium]
MKSIILSDPDARFSDLEEALTATGFSFEYVAVTESLSRRCVLQQSDLIVLTSVTREVLADCVRIRDNAECFPLVMAIFYEDPSYTAEELLSYNVDDFILAPVTPLRLAGRLTFARARIVKRSESRGVEAALRTSEANARAVLETTVDGVITIDVRGTIQSFNRAAERIFGYTPQEVIGQGIQVLMPQPMRDEHDGYMRSYLETGHAKIIGIGREVQGLRKDGSVFPMDLAVSEVVTNGQRGFTGIVRDISYKRQLERELLRISEQERRRIGQDLHDGLGQMLTGIGLIAQNLARKMERNGAAEASDVAEIARLVKDADQQARTLARGLVPIEFHSNGLSIALERLATNASRMFGIPCSFEEIGEKVHVYDSSVATHLYRIAQEATNNAAKHSEASQIKMLLASGQGQLRLRVQDNGRGIRPRNSDSVGMGLNIMKYRAQMIGGALDLRTSAADGTVITCTVPYANKPDRSDDAYVTEQETI